MASPFWFSVGPQKENYLHFFLNVCPFDYTAFLVSGKVGIPTESDLFLFILV